MDYAAAFKASVARVRAEGRYRVFADLLRKKGEFPKARYRADDGSMELLTTAPQTIVALDGYGLEIAGQRELS